MAAIVACEAAAAWQQALHLLEAGEAGVGREGRAVSVHLFGVWACWGGGRGGVGWLKCTISLLLLRKLKWGLTFALRLPSQLTPLTPEPAKVTRLSAAGGNGCRQCSHQRLQGEQEVAGLGLATAWMPAQRCVFWLFWWNSIDGNSWFNWQFNHLPGKPIYFPEKEGYVPASLTHS